MSHLASNYPDGVSSDDIPGFNSPKFYTAKKRCNEPGCVLLAHPDSDNGWCAPCELDGWVEEVEHRRKHCLWTGADVEQAEEQVRYWRERV